MQFHFRFLISNLISFRPDFFPITINCCNRNISWDISGQCFWTCIQIFINKISNRVRQRVGWRNTCGEALILKVMNSKDAGRPRLTHHHRGKWNDKKWMRWEWRNGGTKFVVGRNPEKNLPRPHFVHHETHMEWPPRRKLGTPEVGGERLTAYAMRPPHFYSSR